MYLRRFPVVFAFPFTNQSCIQDARPRLASSSSVMSSSKRRIIPSGTTKVAVLPRPEPTAPPRQAGPRQPLRWWKVPVGIYNWALWFFIVTIVLSQFLGIVSNSTKSVMYNDFGQSPLLGTSSISGDNDDPYSDRMIVCKLRGRLYKPALVSAVLAEPSTVLVDSDGSAINGYRVIKRNTATLTPDAYALYSNTCDEIAATLDAILDSCTALGYNVTRDNLRVVDDLNSLKMYLIPNSLPVLVMPYWDNSPYPHYAIPGWDGSACAFRLTGKYQSQAYSTSTMFGPDRSVRESKTAEWLKRPGGAWKNGWYEDLTGAKWYSDIATTDLHDPYGINQRLFNTISNQERNLSHSTDFVALPVTTWWGDKLSVTDTAHDLNVDSDVGATPPLEVLEQSV